MKQFVHIFLLRLKLLFADRKQLISFFVVPFLAFVALYFFYEETVEEGKIPIGLLDLNQTDYSARIVERLLTHDSIRVVLLEESALKQKVVTNQVDTAVVITSDFKAKLENGETKQLIEVFHSNTSLATPIVKEVLAAEVMRLLSNKAAADRVIDRIEKYGLTANPAVEEQNKSSNRGNGHSSLEEMWLAAWEYTDAQWEPIPLMTIKVTELDFYKSEVEIPVNKSLEPLLLIISTLMMYFAFSLSHWVFEDQLVRKRFMFSVLRASHYFLGNFFAAYLVAFVQLVIFVGLFVVIVPNVSFVILGSLLVMYIACCLLIGIIIASFCRSVKQALVVNLVVVAATSMLVGPQQFVVEGVIANMYGRDFFQPFLSLSMLTLLFFVTSYVIVRWNNARCQ